MTHTIKQVNFLRDLVHKKRHIYGNAVYYYSDGSGTYPDWFRVLGVFFIKAHFTDPFVRIYSKIWFRVLPDSSLNHRSTPGQPPEGRLKKLLIWESASATILPLWIIIHKQATASIHIWHIIDLYRQGRILFRSSCFRKKWRVLICNLVSTGKKLG